MAELSNLKVIDFENKDSEEIPTGEDYDLVREEIDEAFSSEEQSTTFTGRVVAATMMGVTVGIVSFLLRAGSLLPSVMSTLPLWRGFDPIAIFPGESKRKKKDVSKTGESKAEAFLDSEAQ